MPALYSIDEIQKNFDDSAANAENSHLSKSVKWMVVANLLLISGFAAMFFSHPIFAALLLLSAVLFNQKSNTHHVLAEMSNQHRAMAHLIAASSPNGVNPKG